MIIKSIEIKNFLSYYDTTEFKFDEGATLIIGQNNTGKSKLFDAYNWVLYDEAYETAAEDWVSTGQWKEQLVNRFAKLNCNTNSKVEVSVSLNFEDENSNSYLVNREYRVLKISDSEWSCPGSSDIAVTKTNAVTFNTQNFMGNEANELLSAFFPKNLSRYFLFQGEGISKLLRLNQRSDFTRAIGELSGIKYFDKARKYADKVYLRAKDQFENKEERNAEVQKQKVKITKDIDDINERVTDLKNKLENEYREKDIKERKLEEKEEELSRYEECAKLLQEIKSLEKQRDEKVDQKGKLFEYNRNGLMSLWIYNKSEGLIDNFLRLYRKAKEEAKIPEPIRQDFIKEMLQDHLCKVCGTDAPEHSPQYHQISSFINEKSLDKEIAVINALSDTADSLKSNITHIPDNIKEFRDELNQVQQELDGLRTKIVYKEDELRIVTERIEDEKKIGKIQRADLEKINLSQLTKDRDQIKIDLDQSKGKIDQISGRKDEADKSLKKLEDEYKALIERSENQFERERMLLAQNIKDEVYKLYDNFLGNLIGDIEEEANTYFENMTRTNPALSGKVRVDYENREVYTVDESGIPMANINQANKVSLQISFVAAVLSVSNRIWDKHFPFVADAPISALGGNNKISAIKTIIDIFRQSIVILKDDADLENIEGLNNEQVRQLIKNNGKIRNAYELRMEGATINEQRTKIIKLK
ncbi:AAA family ATPase [Mucilaginibacter xinganensis]|uniref:Rad50/SbcC-type AAA domain-containing protein n=1 Tax=Mucilaginibacter xinganensis TaxID=1234841 RepID=A0A223NWI7_9SPHI|nr:AAA family ATPase [Mucilaginibacter xinganensis]ASU34249.1 hypothetical protein MuYL_2360 [Mucilaginibacter xinganensis]